MDSEKSSSENSMCENLTCREPTSNENDGETTMASLEVFPRELFQDSRKSLAGDLPRLNSFDIPNCDAKLIVDRDTGKIYNLSAPDRRLEGDVNTRDLLTKIAKELIDSREPNLTKETLVLRTLKNLSERTFNLPWSRVLENLRHGQCHFDEMSHFLLKRALEHSVYSNDEVIERIASRDYVKKSDVDRLANILGSSNFKENVRACTLFAVDGFCGFHDLKQYGNNFKYYGDFRELHVRAVRNLYLSHGCDASKVVDVVERAIEETTESKIFDPFVEIYVNIVRRDNVPAIRAWKTKEKQQVAENLAKAKKAAERKNENEVKKVAAKSNASSSEDDKVSDSVGKVNKKRKREDQKTKKSEDAKKRKREEKKVKHAEKKQKVEAKKQKHFDMQRHVENEQKEKSNTVVAVSNSDFASSSEDEAVVLKTLIKTARDFEEREIAEQEKKE